MTSLVQKFLTGLHLVVLAGGAGVTLPPEAFDQIEDFPEYADGFC